MDLLNKVLMGSLVSRPGNVIIDYTEATGETPETVTKQSDGNFTFTVPANVIKVTICMCGGGGRGDDISTKKGGSAGEKEENIEIDVMPFEEVTVKIANRNSSTYYSEFKSLKTFTGISYSYEGDGAEFVGCGGTYNDGVAGYDEETHLTWYGGEAGLFGDGGDGYDGTHGFNSEAKGPGAGGGGHIAKSNGGYGRCVISW